jgi:hypothetical protein
MKLVTRGLLEDQSPASAILGDPGHPDYQKILAIKKNGMGTPRFPTEEEIEIEERKLLLTFAFKDEEEVDSFRKEMSIVVNTEYQIDRPPEIQYKQLRHQLRSKINTFIKHYRVPQRCEENFGFLRD